MPRHVSSQKPASTRVYTMPSQQIQPVESHPAPHTMAHIPLLDRDRLGKVTREVNIQTLSHREPVSHELERNNVEQTL